MRIDLSKLTEAERLLWEHGVTSPKHIDLDAIASALGVKVVYRPLCGCEARLVGDHERAIITINNRDVTQGRQLFSLAHEIAHWRNDRHLRLVTCVQDDMSPKTMEAKGIESAANDFASQLVLPNYLTAPIVDGLPFNLDTAAKLKYAFRCSMTAAAIRMARLSRGAVAVFCHTRTSRAWITKGLQLPMDLNVVRVLHHETDAFAMVFGSGLQISRPKVEPANRWLGMHEAFRREVSVQSMKLPGDRVLTALELHPEKKHATKRR